VTQFDTTVPLSRSLPRDALVLATGMAVANAGNYVFNLVMAFLLGPEAYGALAALLALVLVGSVPGLALQAVVARRTAMAGPGDGSAWPGMLRLGVRAGLGLALLAALAGPGLALFLHLDSAVPVLWLALALVPTPLLFAVQGLLQGRERFGALAVVMVAGAAVKLTAGLALVVAGLGVGGALAGVAAGGALAALAGLRLAGTGGPATPGADRPSPGPPTWREVGVATTGLLGLFLLANLDVLLARHYLGQAASGHYSLGAVVAKIAFWAPQFVVTLVFTRLVGAADPRRLLAGSAGVITGFGVLLAGGLAAADRLGLAVPVLGQGYAGLGPLLPLFAALGTALALVQLLLFEGIATRDRRMGGAVVAALAVEVVLVAGPLHGGVGQVAGAALVVAVLLAGAGWWLVRHRPGRHPAPAPVP
jgi:O-antigen/teichoic acid export membrane protein